MKWLVASASLFLWVGCSSDDTTGESGDTIDAAATGQVEASCLAELGQTASIAAGSFTMG
ncbi:MAG: hypothetical protein ACI9OJ_003661, partial [Myxococcota bacterium]